MLAPAAPTEAVASAAEFLRRKLAGSPAVTARVAVVLGSGLGGFARELKNPASILFREIPYFPATTVPGHEGRLVAGLLGETPVLVLQGRVHGYEGYRAEHIAFPIRTLGAFGVKAVVLTNAAGGIRLDLRPGQLVLISDHINLSGMNPATGTAAQLEPEQRRAAAAHSGVQPGEFGPRFFDMSQAYSKRLRELAHRAASERGADLAEGVYIGVPGPSFETPAEIRAFRAWGADLVGMSTVVETIAARQIGLEVLGLSCVTNMAAGVESATLSHQEVIDTGRSVEAELTGLLGAIVPRIARGLSQAGGA